MQNCPNCGTPKQSADQNFCENCGSPLPSTAKPVNPASANLPQQPGIGSSSRQPNPVNQGNPTPGPINPPRPPQAGAPVPRQPLPPNRIPRQPLPPNQGVPPTRPGQSGNAPQPPPNPTVVAPVQMSLAAWTDQMGHGATTGPHESRESDTGADNLPRLRRPVRLRASRFRQTKAFRDSRFRQTKCPAQ